MRIAVKLLSPAGEMPAGFDEFGDRDMDVPENATVASVVDGLKLPAEESYTTIINGESVPLSERGGRHLADGDEVVLFPAIQGGA